MNAYIIYLVVLVFYSCLGNIPQTGYLKISETYSLTVTESRNLKSRCRQGHILSKISRSGNFLPSPSFWQSQAFSILWQPNSNLCLCVHMSVFLLCISVSKFCSSCKDTSHIGSDRTRNIGQIYTHMHTHTHTDSIPL